MLTGTLVFVHGWSTHGGYFDEVISLLQHKRQVFAPTLPGHGREPADPEQATIEYMARWLRDQIHKRELTDCVLCGWSMGAHVLLSYLEQFGERDLAAIVIVEMSPRILMDDKWNLGLGDFSEADNQAFIDIVKSHWESYSHTAADRIFAKRAGCKERSPEHIEKIKAWVREEIKLNDEAFLARLWWSMSKQDFRHLLPAITLPTLVISGALSQLYCVATGEYIAERIKNARHVTLEASGHAPHLEQPRAFIKALQTFLDESG